MNTRSGKNNNKNNQRYPQKNIENSRLSRDKRRRKQLPFYKKNGFIITTIIVVIIVVVAAFIIWNVNEKSDNKTVENNIQKVSPTKKTTEKKPKAVEKKSKKQADQKVKDETKNSDESKSSDNEQSTDTSNDIKNPGSYDNLVYKTDWYTFKFSNDVKLVKDANGDAALLVKYTYTNNTQSAENPQKVQANDITLKQDDKALSPTSPTGDYADLVNATNSQSVKTGDSFDGALLVKVDNTDSNVNMYFKNVQTNADLDTMQPFKLK
ncbi:DUF5067 domain-containing protein [Companilactobacillus allii]|uniref:Uncharacterized protein n=1 Tax=Companilactobacillus allii TaxID=1847728 RepID=A0A1P8PZU4_9LACO|nr:DUF5067 domain-containing protein [Companilactobacillus allii]APX71115.1 hypothetical protein BTM29_00475 [Companilactobacillus allii]USQ68193.1 DUF5067 domain-containing protein [Companilactobacillus allii]